jgi:hypothetical protein
MDEYLDVEMRNVRYKRPCSWRVGAAVAEYWIQSIPYRLKLSPSCSTYLESMKLEGNKYVKCWCNGLVCQF